MAPRKFLIGLSLLMIMCVVTTLGEIPRPWAVVATLSLNRGESVYREGFLFIVPFVLEGWGDEVIVTITYPSDLVSFAGIWPVEGWRARRGEREPGKISVTFYMLLPDRLERLPSVTTLGKIFFVPAPRRQDDDTAMAWVEITQAKVTQIIGGWQTYVPILALIGVELLPPRETLPSSAE